jgi:hypothetical protein
MSDNFENHFIDDELYLENIELKYMKKIFNIESDIINDDTFIAIKTLITLNESILDLSGLLLEGTLKIDSKLNSIIDFGKIKKIYCSNNYFDTIIIDIPNSIKEFMFENNPIKKIFFPYSFNNQIDNLPNTLEIIIFPHNSIFNKPINDLPTSLKILCLGNYFDQVITNLPNNIEHLILPNNYNYQIIKLPSNLKTLIFNSEVDNSYNEFHYVQPNFELNYLPINLEFLSLPINCDVNKLYKLCKFINNPKIIIFKSPEAILYKGFKKSYIKKYLDQNNYKNIEFVVNKKKMYFKIKQYIFYK